MKRLFLFIGLMWTSLACVPQSNKVVTGAEQLDLLLPKLWGKRVALVVNQTAVIKKTHLADTLKSRGVTILKVFTPDHGFRGTAADGEHINDTLDTKTGIPLVSLYGKDRKPNSKQLSDIDIVLFDIQDVGARFYTFISTLHYVMEACAENGKSLILLDRPNPNGYVDGPILLPELKSFVGMHPVPIVHGLTIGELTLMINGEGWLEGKKKCNVDIVKLKNWEHADEYSLPIRPSPNLPNDQAIRLYASSNHLRDWLDCVRRRKRPICDVEIGCRSVTVCHLGNLAYWNRRRLKWDPKKEQFIGDKEANTWLDRPKRAPWKI